MCIGDLSRIPILARILLDLLSLFVCDRERDIAQLGLRRSLRGDVVEIDIERRPRGRADPFFEDFL